MNRLLLKLAVAVMVGSLLYSAPAATQESPTTKKAAGVRITQGPELESANNNSAIIRWTSNNPGGSPEHYGVVRYGTNLTNLSQTAKSPIRLNPGPSLYRFPRAHGRPQASDNLLLYGGLDGGQWEGQRGEERRQAFHHALREKFGWASS